MFLTLSKSCLNLDILLQTNWPFHTPLCKCVATAIYWLKPGDCNAILLMNCNWLIRWNVTCLLLAFITNQALHPAPSRKKRRLTIRKTVVTGDTASHFNVTPSPPPTSCPGHSTHTRSCTPRTTHASIDWTKAKSMLNLTSPIPKSCFFHYHIALCVCVRRGGGRLHPH